MGSAMTDNSGGSRKKGADSYSAYEWHANTLRTWLVAYGIGVPAIFLTQDTLRTKLIASAYCFQITNSFLLGVAYQVLLAFLNKTAMWIYYYGKEENNEFKKHVLFEPTKRFTECYWFDFAVDLVTIVLFAFATYRTSAVILHVVV